MKVLHVGNTAGQGGLLARELDKRYDSNSICLGRKTFDPFDLMTQGRLVEGRARHFYWNVFWEVMKSDIVHFHDLDGELAFLKNFFRKKKMVLHYHGSKIRGKWHERRKFWEKADLIMVSTDSLLNGAPLETTHFPRIVDDELLDLYIDNPHRILGGYHVSLGALDKAIELGRKHGVTLVVQDRSKKKLPHRKFIELLSDFEYYVDVKKLNDGNLNSLFSLTGLEALKMGLKVILPDGKVYSGFPKFNKTDFAIDVLRGHYEKLLE